MSSLPVDLTLFGQRLTGVRIPIGSTVTWDLTLLDPSALTAIDLTAPNTAVVMSLAQLGINGLPTLPAVATWSAALPTVPPLNECGVTWQPSDTVPSGAPFTPGAYLADVWLEVSGSRVQMASISVWLTPTARLPVTS